MDKPPIPDNSDTRPRDLIQAQSAKRQVSDPLSSTSGSSPSSANMSRAGGASPDGVNGGLYVGTSAHGVGLGNSNVIDDLVHSAVRNTLKGVTINGASPNMLGSRIEFDVPLSVGAATLFPQVNPSPAINAPADQSSYPNFLAPPTLVTSNKSYDLVRHIGASSIDEQLKYFSRKKLKGESRSEYRERQQEIRDLKKSGDFEGVVAAIKDGNSSYFFKSYVPVLLPRADGKCTSLLGFDLTSAYVIENTGLSGKVNFGTLPDPSDYYVAGIPRGCPYDLRVGVVSEEESYLSAVKHTGCDSNNIGNNNYERYAAVRVDEDAATFTSYFGVSSDSYYATTVKADESSFWGYDPSGYNFKTVASQTQTLMELWEGNGNYFGAYTKADKAGHYLQNGSSFFGAVIKDTESSFWGYDPNGHNFKTVASQTQTLMELWEGSGNYFGAYTKADKAGHYLQNSNSFLGGVIKSSESSLWGYTGSGPNYMLKSTSSKADLQLWSSSGPTTSAWADNSTAGVKVEKGNDYSFLDMGKLWMDLAGAEFYGYGGGLYIKNTDDIWVDIQPPDKNCWFQTVLMGDMTTRWVLCSEDVSNDVDYCDTLANPSINTLMAYVVKTIDVCGDSDKYAVLDLWEATLSLGLNNGEGSLTDTNGYTVWNNGGFQGNLESTNLWMTGPGAYYAQVNADGGFTAGGLSYQGNLDSQNLFMTSPGAYYAQVNASGGFTAGGSGHQANLEAANLWITAGGSWLHGYAGGLYIKGGTYVDIQPPSKNAYFQPVTYVNSSWELETREFLCTEGNPGTPGDECAAVVQCVIDSGVFPTWTEANEAYVDWATLASYPTWTETNQTYVDWATLKNYPTWTETNQTYVDWQTLNNVVSQIAVAIQSELVNALLRLGVDATCEQGLLRVTLTGLPSTSVNTPNWPTNLGPGMSA